MAVQIDYGIWGLKCFLFCCYPGAQNMVYLYRFKAIQKDFQPLALYKALSLTGLAYLNDEFSFDITFCC